MLVLLKKEIDFKTELLDFLPSKYITLNLSSQTNVICILCTIFIKILMYTPHNNGREDQQKK